MARRNYLRYPITELSLRRFSKNESVPSVRLYYYYYYHYHHHYHDIRPPFFNTKSFSS